MPVKNIALVGLVVTCIFVASEARKCAAATRAEVADEAGEISDVASRLARHLERDLHDLQGFNDLRQMVQQVGRSAEAVERDANRDTTYLLGLESSITALERDVMELVTELRDHEDEVDDWDDRLRSARYEEAREMATEILDRTSRLAPTVEYIDHFQKYGEFPNRRPTVSHTLPSGTPGWNEYPSFYSRAYGEVLGQ